MLAMVCDIRVAGERAFFSIPVADMAIGVEGTIVELLTSLVGAGGRAPCFLPGCGWSETSPSHAE